MSQQPEALRLADLLCCIDVGGLKNAWLDKAAVELRRLHAENAELIQELRNIASADWRKWDEEMRTPDEFVYWAKSRARFAIAKAKAEGESK